MTNSIVNLLREVIPLIPVDSPFRAELQQFLDSIFCELPEDNDHLWQQAQQIFVKHLPIKLEACAAWQKRVVELWQTNAVDEASIQPTTPAQSEPQVHSSAWLAAADMLQTISSSGYSAEYERGWNAAVRHNRYVLKCAGGDPLACAALGKYPKASNDRLCREAGRKDA